MTNELQIHKGCVGKCQYKSHELAIRVAERCQEDRGRPIRVYECPFCNYWHLSSKPELGTLPDALCGMCLDAFTPTSPSDWCCLACQS